MDDLEVVQRCASCGGTDECHPLVHIPAWWSGFLFHVLNPRQLSMYVYLTMLADEQGICHPTIDQIRKDLGLLSTTMVFESLTVLEEYGLFLRSRQSLPESRSRRNVYRRTACEYTVLRLLETNKIDAEMHPVSSGTPASEESRELVQEGLKNILGDAYGRYKAAAGSDRRDLLLEALNELLRSRKRGIYF